MKKTIIAIIGAASLSGAASAQIYDFTWDRSDGPTIAGYIDLGTDDLFVTSWTESPGGIDPWTPVVGDLPLVFSARVQGIGVSFPGVAYDLTGTPDFSTFNNNAFRFYSDLHYEDINYNEGVYTGPNAGTRMNFAGGGSFNSVLTSAAGGNAGMGATSSTFTVRAVPEPSSALLLGLGGFGFLLRRKRS